MPKYIKLIDLSVSDKHIIDSTGNTYWTYESDGATNEVPSNMSSLFYNQRFAVNTKGEETYTNNCLYTLTNDIVNNTKLGPIIKNYKLEIRFRLSRKNIGNILYFGYDPSNPSYRAFNIFVHSFYSNAYRIGLGSYYMGDAELFADVDVSKNTDNFHHTHTLIVSSYKTKFELSVEDADTPTPGPIITHPANFPLNLNYLINIGKAAAYATENGVMLRVYSMTLSVPEENCLKVY